MVPPVYVVLKLIAVVVLLLHKDWLATGFTVTDGFTVIVNVIDVPAQLPPALVYVGVTIIVAVIGAVVVLVAMKDAMLPNPFAANPIDGVLFTQLNTTLLPPLPLLGLVNAIAVVD
jgi:hypothetical protein